MDPDTFRASAFLGQGVVWTAETLSVLESERGHGVGGALTDAVAELAAEAGAGSVLVGVAHSNADAIRFYEREGFERFYMSLIRPAASSASPSSR